MKASWLYRIAAVLLVLFAILHTIGFRQNIPGAGSVIVAMQSTHIDAQGFSRSYWDFFSAFGLFFSVFLLLAAVLAWQLSRIPPGTFGPFARQTAWALAISFVIVTALSWEFAFTAPIVFSMVVMLLLVGAAWLSPKPKAD
jgi:hypothetical protein